MHIDSDQYNEIPELLETTPSKRLNRLLSDLIHHTTGFMQRKYGLPRTEAEEYAHQAIEQLLNRLLKKKDFNAHSIYGYTVTCAQNNYFERYRRDRRMNIADVSEWILPEEPDPLSEMYETDARKIIDQTLSTMPKNAQRVARLYLSAPDLNYREAAKILNLSLTNLRTIKSRTLSKLRERVSRLL